MDYIHSQLMKARHDDRLRDAAQRRLAAQARQMQPRWRDRPEAGQALRLAGLRPRNLFTRPATIRPDQRHPRTEPSGSDTQITTPGGLVPTADEGASVLAR